MKKYFISTPNGAEELLLSELSGLGVAECSQCVGGAYFKSSPHLALKVLLSSRVASRIYLELSKFTISSEQELVINATNWPWENVFDLDQTFKIDSSFDRAAKRRFRNSLLLSQKLKDGIVDRFRQKQGKRPNVDLKRPHITILMRIEQAAHNPKRFTVRPMLDLCGTPLSNRGYRRAIVHQAPLRENLAAAIMLLTGWNHEQGKLVDSMCGSATLLIEGALIANKVPPSYLKIDEYLSGKSSPWSFLNHLWFKNDHTLQRDFQSLIKQLNQASTAGLANIKPNQIFGYDKDVPSLKIARDATNRAKLSHAIKLSQQCATKLTPPGKDGGKDMTIVCNPPYGERLGEKDILMSLYHQYGENLKRNFKGGTAFILVPSTELRKQISLQTKRRIPLFNGGFECRLCQYRLF